MIGVNEENLDKLIKLNNMNHIDLENHIKKMIFFINDMCECYSGKDLNFIFSCMEQQKLNINKISKVIKAYSDVLYNVKVSYNKQDNNISRKINQINSNL